MKVLLDENLPHSLRGHFGRHQVQTAAYAGFAGRTNGQQLDAAETAGFDVLVTGDRTFASRTESGQAEDRARVALRNQLAPY